jgi:hypothetical protein
MGCVRLFAILALAATTSGALACKSSPRTRPLATSPVEKGAGSLEAARKYLQGRWSLVSFEVRPAGGQPVVVKGSGSLVFDDHGNLTLELHTDDATAERLTAAGVPMQQGALMQEGRTVVDLQNHTLTYVLPGAPPPGAPSGPLATSRPRYWQVDGNMLTLTTRDAGGNTLSVGRWQKVQ